MTTKLKSHAHCVSSLHVHIVFVTKYRRKVITGDMLEFLKDTFSRLCLTQKCKLLEFNGESDHVHLLIQYSPDVTLSKVVNNLKAVSSRLVRKEFSDRIQSFYRKAVFWSPSYCAISCGGAPLSVLKQYIENQKTPS